MEDKDAGSVTIGGSSIKVGAGIISAFLLAAAGWAVTMDRQSVRINVALDNIQKQLDAQNLKLVELNTIEKRVTRIEDTRFTQRDAEVMTKRCTKLEERLRFLEIGLKD